MTERKLPPAYNGCACACHKVPGVMHMRPCCQPSDAAPTEQPIAVTQGDRNFTADYLKARGKITDRDHDRICQGFWDATADVLDVARFRLAERERCAKVADENRTDDDSMWDRAADTIATAIRSSSDAE